MNNPFFATSEYDGSQYLTPRCSLNRALMSKLPLYGVDDAIEGLGFSQIFSTRLIVEEIRRLERYYGLDLSDIPDRQLPKILDEALVSEDIRLNQLARRVVGKFGRRLGLILLALKKGEEGNRLARPDWDDSCWQLWHDIETVILTGGLASSRLGRRFKEQIRNIFDMAGERGYDIRLYDNGAYLGVMGIAQQLMRDDTYALVLDLGQTNFKRAVVHKTGERIADFTPMDTLPSLHTDTARLSDSELTARAVALHQYIVKCIAESYREASLSTELDNTVLISIASYTHSGILNDERGGYAKLNRLGDNYAALLEEELSGELHRNIRVRLVHDGTATALYFSDVENAVCITIGTGFGVGFPDIKI